MLYSTKYFSPVGTIILAGDRDSIKGLWIEGQKYFCEGAAGNMEEKDDIPVLLTGKEWLDEYFAGKRPEISRLPLSPEGSDFRLAVWRLLTQIPYGEVTTYGEIAKKISFLSKMRNTSARAVGGAVGHNPVSIIIPCHRVIGAGGNLTGYAGGIDIKIKLLRHEGVDMSGMYYEKKQ